MRDSKAGLWVGNIFNRAGVIMCDFKISTMYLLVMKLNIITPLVVGAKPVYPCGISSVIIGKPLGSCRFQASS